MSKVTNTVNTENQNTNQYDRSFITLGGNRYESADFSANGSEQTLEAGQLMGRIAATGAVVPLVATANDGSEIPFGILTTGQVIPANETPSLSICVCGRVAKEKVVLSGAETFATLVDGRRLEDRIAGDTVGIQLIAGTENCIPDND